MMLVAGCSGNEPEPGPNRPPSPTAYAEMLFKATNEVRVELGLSRLRHSNCLEAEAKPRAEALVGKPLNHSPLTDVTARCAPRGRVAENLVETTKAPDAVLEAWMKSSGHRNNLVDPALAQMGISCVAHEQYVCVQLLLAR